MDHRRRIDGARRLQRRRRAGLTSPIPTQQSKEQPMPWWIDEELRKAAEGANWIKFESIGDTAEGTIAEVRKRKFGNDGDERTVIEVEFTDGSRVTIGQWLLLRTLYFLHPEKGDYFSATLVDLRKQGSKTTKLFKGRVERI